MIETGQLASTDPQTQVALTTGWLRPHANSPAQRVIARKLLPEDTVLFEKIEQTPRRPRGLGPWLQAIRAFSLTATGTPCLAVFVLALARGESLSGWSGLSAILGVVGLQIAINVFNDVEDYRRLIDLPGTLGGSGVIQKGWWPPAELKNLAWKALGIGSACGLPAVFRSPETLIPISAIAGGGVLLYSGKKIGLKYVALGDLAVWILCGPALTLGFALAITHRDALGNPGVIWLGAYFGFLAVALLHVNNLQDMKLDLNRGVQTLAIRLGFRGSLIFLAALYLLAIVSIIMGVLRGDLPMGSLACAGVTAAVSLPWLKRIFGALGPESSLLSQCRIKAAQIHLISGIACVLGIGLGMGWGRFFA